MFIQSTGLQGKTKSMKPVLHLATIIDGPSVYLLYSVLLPAVKSLAESSSASLLVFAVAKKRQRVGLPLLPLGAIFK